MVEVCLLIRGKALEKLAVLELSTYFIKMQQVEVIRNKSFAITNELVMPINLLKDFYNDNFIKPAVSNEITDILSVFRTILDREEITETICFATNILSEAKNSNSFLNEIHSASGFKFEILTPDNEIHFLYSAVINTFNKPKGVICNVGEYATEFLMYNRRNILNSAIIPFGSLSMERKYGDLQPEEKCEKITAEISAEIAKIDWLKEVPEEFEYIGTGTVFKNLGVLSRRATKYPLDIEHNYPVSKENFDKVYSVIKPVDSSKNSKLKGLTVSESMSIGAGLSIINALFSSVAVNQISISKSDKEMGMLFKHIIPLTNEKPISDSLGFSLQVINDFYDKKPNNIQQIYDLSMLLFKQLKVLHKLGRPYIRILRIASSMYNCGLRVNYKYKEKSGFSIIENSDLYGVSHSEIVLACFVCKLRDSDNLNLSEWVKYKELINEEDLIAVKKLAVILKVAESLDITGYSVIKDISCDILGDSVIMKTIVEGNPYLEIKHAMLAGSEFKKAFNKNLEVL